MILSKRGLTMATKNPQITCTLKYKHFNSDDVVTIVEQFDLDTSMSSLFDLTMDAAFRLDRVFDANFGRVVSFNFKFPN